MLGSVARKLRIFGFDTAYLAHTSDDQILKMGMEQGRTILTADKEFFKRIVKHGAQGVLVDGSNDLGDLAHILGKMGITQVSVALGSRCASCNGILEDRSKGQVEVPPAVAGRHREFYQCIRCGKVYWEGGHMKKMRAFAEALERRLNAGPEASKG
jgi:uncharacterized protein with PIN domain